MTLAKSAKTKQMFGFPPKGSYESPPIFLQNQELEAIKARVKEMEEEAEKLKEMQKQVEDSLMSPTGSAGTGNSHKDL